MVALLVQVLAALEGAVTAPMGVVAVDVGGAEVALAAEDVVPAVVVIEEVEVAPTGVVTPIGVVAVRVGGAKVASAGVEVDVLAAEVGGPEVPAKESVASMTPGPSVWGANGESQVAWVKVLDVSAEVLAAVGRVGGRLTVAA